MNKDNSFPLDLWCQIFKTVCQQVERTEINSAKNRINIFVKGQSEPLQFTHNELDAASLIFNNNVVEVVHSLMKEKGVLVIYKNTLVGFFDIQAYSDFIDKTSFTDTVWKTNKLVSSIKSAANTDVHGVKFDCWILSDSIILVIDTERSRLFAGSIEFFLGTCSVIMANAMRERLPLRGAIGGGDFFKDGEIMVSSALVDAAHYEKEQNWLGAVLTPTAVILIEKAMENEIKLKDNTITTIDFLSDRFNSFVKHGEIPWKKRDSRTNPNELYYIKPFQMSDKDWNFNYLPPYFKDDEKVKNSICLYGQK